MQIDWAFNQDVEYLELITHSGWKKPQLADPVSLKVHLEFKQQLIRAANGDEAMSNLEIHAPLTFSPKADDRFIFEEKIYKIMDASRPVSIYGEASFQKIYCGSVEE